MGPVPVGKDPDGYDRLRRRVLWSMPSGLYVVGTRAAGRRNLMTISWATQVAVNPKLVGIGVESGAVTHDLLDQGGVFALSLLPRSQRAIVRRFAKPVTETVVDEATGAGTMQGEPVRMASTGAPILDVGGVLARLRGAPRPGAGEPHLVRGRGRRLRRIGAGPDRYTLGSGSRRHDRRRCPAHGGHPDELRRLKGGPGRGSAASGAGPSDVRRSRGRRSTRRVRMPSSRRPRRRRAWRSPCSRAGPAPRTAGARDLRRGQAPRADRRGPVPEAGHHRPGSNSSGTGPMYRRGLPTGDPGRPRVGSALGGGRRWLQRGRR